MAHLENIQTFDNCKVKAEWCLPKISRIKIGRTMSGSPGLLDLPNGDTIIPSTT